MKRFGHIALVVFAWLMCAQPAQGFDYLEHSYFTDRACWQAQTSLLALLEASAPDSSKQNSSTPQTPDDLHASQNYARLRARYLALALVCPERPAVYYCVDERKAVTSHINRLSNEPWTSSSHPITLGDYSALADHVSRLGPVRGLGGARERGLTVDFFRWFARGYGSVGGIAESVGSAACWDTENVDWPQIEQGFTQTLTPVFASATPEAVPAELLNPLRRERSRKGPSDPAGLYSFSNPHYLDLVLRNHHHFGVQAYDTWLGYHTASIAISEDSCAKTFALRASDARRIARNMTGFENVRWSKLDAETLAKTGCAMLGELTRRRLLQWRTRADLRLSQPLAPYFEELARLGSSTGRPDALTEARLRKDLDAVVASLVALVFEGSGIHYLQDGFAGGHIRTIRTRGGLAEARYDHDHDNAEGVAAILRTRSGDYPFVAYGDSHLLNTSPEPDNCDWQEIARADVSTARVRTCLVRHQRALVVGTSAASLLDWALGGLLFEPVEENRCDEGPVQSAVCSILPITAVRAPGEISPRTALSNGMHRSTLPIPPPPFGYESLVTLAAFDVSGSNTQYGLQLTILSELDTFANWMTSYRMALFLSPGEGDANRFVGEFSYNFHWRWSARFLLEAGAFGFAGFRGLGEQISFLSGLGPSAGLVALPEGWVKIPLELSISYRFPMRFFTSRHGFFGESFGIEGHWLQFGLGLAFM